MKKTKNFKFKFQRNDTWGNALVHCPVCLWTFKLDGVRKHIIRKYEEGEKRHKEWFKKNGWQRGTRDAARPRVLRQ